MTHEVTGIDVSKWQKEINWELALSQGISFAFIRASEGSQLVDPYLERNLTRTAELGIPRGLYHYFKPSKDWKTQVEHFSSICKGCQFELDPVVDMETNAGLSKNELNNVLAKFIQHCEAAIGRKLMIYTSPGFFNSRLPLTDYAWRCRLWVAHWTSAGTPSLPDEWRNHSKSWTFWQHSARNSLGEAYGVATKSICLDRFNGSRDRFMQTYQLTSLPTPPAPPPPAPTPPGPAYYRVTTSALHIFNAPQLNATITGDLRQGEIVPLLGVSGTDEVWIRIGEGQWCLYAYNGVELMDRQGN